METKKSPVYNVLSIPVDKIRANAYNPNSVASPEMKLLETSIWEDLQVIWKCPKMLFIKALVQRIF